MKKYIEINENNQIIDVFFEYQKSKMASDSKILLEDTDIIKHKINDLSISNEYGAFIFNWTNDAPVERTQEVIDSDTITVNGKINKTLEELEDEDKNLTRGTEDLIDHLIEKEIIVLYDLKKELKDRYNKKKELRTKL